MVSYNRDIIDFVGTPPFLRFVLLVAMATKHFHKVQTCVSFKNIFFRILGRPRSILARVRNRLKGDRKAKLDDIGGIGHLLTFFFCKKQFSFGSPQFGPKKCLTLKKKKKKNAPS